MLIFDCHELKADKRYSYCILNLAQAWEMFFSLYLRVSLIYRPFAIDGSRDLNRLNALLAQLYDLVGGYSYRRMRSLFLGRVLDLDEPESLDAAERAVLSLPNLREPTDQAIASCKDLQLAALLKRLKYSRVAELRNSVVHHVAHRPTLSEVESALNETRELVYPLKHILGVDSDDINWYMGTLREERQRRERQ